jgi:hypothetical protein
LNFSTASTKYLFLSFRPGRKGKGEGKSSTEHHGLFKNQ